MPLAAAIAARLHLRTLAGLVALVVALTQAPWVALCLSESPQAHCASRVRQERTTAHGCHQPAPQPAGLSCCCRDKDASPAPGTSTQSDTARTASVTVVVSLARPVPPERLARRLADGSNPLASQRPLFTLFSILLL